MSAETKQYQYYTLTSREKFTPSQGDVEVIKPVKEPNSIKKLGNILAQGYFQNRIMAFNNGDNPQLLRSDKHRLPFEEEITRLAAARCRDLFTQDGKVRPESAQEWSNVLDIAPKVNNVLLNRENYVESISLNQAANLAAYAIDVARNPELLGETVLNTAYGGSDDEYATTRLPAYTLPALKIVRELKDLYAEREDKMIKNETEQRLFKVLTSGKDERMLTKDERGQAYAEAGQILNAGEDEVDDEQRRIRMEASPTSEEMEELRKKYSIATKMPTARFFLASNAAIAINHTMEPEKIRARTLGNIDILEQYVRTQHPDVANNVEIIQDIPWERHSAYAKVEIEYLAHLLRTSESESVQKALKSIERHGENHGGEHGGMKAAEYAATHPLYFQDGLDLPWAQFLENVKTNPKVNITIGGHTERRFCALRDELTEKASSEGLMDFIAEKIKNTDEEAEKAELQRMIMRVRRWQGRVAKNRGRYGEKDAYVVRPDRPYQTIEFITSLGDLPTYYSREGYDMPYGSIDLGDQIESLQAMKEQDGADTLTHRLYRNAVIFDLEALRREEE